MHLVSNVSFDHTGFTLEQLSDQRIYLLKGENGKDLLKKLIFLLLNYMFLFWVIVKLL